MLQPFVQCAVALLCIGWLAAQDFVATLDVAQAKIEAKQWREALDLLLGLQARNDLLDEDCVVVAARLRAVSNGLLLADDAEAALRARLCELALLRRVHGEQDHAEVARVLNNVARCLDELGRDTEALPQFEQALAMRRRLFGDSDHADVGTSLNNLGACLDSLGRSAEGLVFLEQAVAMRRRLYGDRDHLDVAVSRSNLAVCLISLGREADGLAQHEQALATRQRLCGGADDAGVAGSLNNVADVLESLGRLTEALPRYEQALAMQKRLHGDVDHLAVASTTNNLAHCLVGLGRAAEALPQFEQSLAMRRRLHGDRDHREVAQSSNNLAWCLLALGRTAEALPQFEQSLAMRRRVFGEGPHATIAQSLNNVAFSLHGLGRPSEALPIYEECLAMHQRLVGERDNESIVKTLNNLGVCLRSLGRPAEAMLQYEKALAMSKRLCGDQDHPLVARSLGNVACCMQLLGHANESLPLHEQALAMRVRLGGNRDHPEVARSLDDLAGCLLELGRASEALAKAEAAIAMIERLRDEVRLSPELRQSFFEGLKRGGAFDRYQSLASRLGRPTDALHAAERSRGRGLLDQLAAFGDPEIEAQRRALRRGDEASAARLAVLRTDLETEYTASDRLLLELTTLAERSAVGNREQQREELLARSNAVSVRLRQLLDERARLLGDVLPVGRVRTAADIQAALQPGELLLEFTVTSDVALVYVVARDGEVQVSELPNAFTTVQRVLPDLLQRSSRAQLRGREPRANGARSAPEAASTELFASLIPAPVWEKIRGSRRVFVAAHRELHCVPFELLATAVKDGKPVYWLDEGPPISYVPSGTLLHWLRQRAREAGDDATSLDLLAIGDPRAPDKAPEVPEDGVFVLAVNDGGEGARAGLQAGDVLVKYDGRPIADDKALRDERMATERAIEDGQRGKTPIAVDVWRRGEARVVEVRPGQLGILVGAGRARAAFAASLGGEAQLARITRAGDLERIASLPALAGARAETDVIDKVFVEHKAKTKRLLGADATEPAVFDLASKAKYVHFACHGIAEEYAGQSLSMLVLSQPQHVLPGDDGLLKLSDLWNSWRGRLSSCRLVVLSACRTNVGPTLRDEAPQALPIGFLFAGVPAVVSSLWAVDDVSTRELMTDFYGRLLAGETDKLAAFTAAKKALRAKYPDPFHWAPFLFLGSPE